ncbi:hypothetical protein K503DRAFT_827085 [Rhizopogon vinicolor AM-OR11-026]|uniref:Uncharacterized protein n=1 Tax=Rhizopogon vinicolor AM-OR11-026 TaxID=1314800 RepID=A0A1B7MU06_9AGAM|nr:hypothetical protein K503DRAFT_827085 [Rhizopogon vinicolor AM-OR11-026]
MILSSSCPSLLRIVAPPTPPWIAAPSVYILTSFFVSASAIIAPSLFSAISSVMSGVHFGLCRIASIISMLLGLSLNYSRRSCSGDLWRLRLRFADIISLCTRCVWGSVQVVILSAARA